MKQKREEKNKGKSLKENIIKNASWNFLTLLVGKIGSIIFAVLLVRLLLPHGYGIYSIVFSFVMAFLAFSTTGIDYATMRYLTYASK